MLTLFLLLHEQYIYTCIMRMVGHITCHSIISVCVCGGGGGGGGRELVFWVLLCVNFLTVFL